MNALAFISRNQAVLQKAKDCGASLILDFGVMIDGSFASRSLLIQPGLSKVAGELGMEINLAVYVSREDTA
jgi:hypothetical protein